MVNLRHQPRRRVVIFRHSTWATSELAVTPASSGAYRPWRPRLEAKVSAMPLKISRNSSSSRCVRQSVPFSNYLNVAKWPRVRRAEVKWRPGIDGAILWRPLETPPNRPRNRHRSKCADAASQCLPKLGIEIEINDRLEAIHASRHADRSCAEAGQSVNSGGVLYEPRNRCVLASA